MSFHCDRDHWSGRMRTLTKNLDRAGELLRLAVNAPRFDEEPFERVREHMNARLRHVANDPGTLANRNWKAKAFPRSPLWPAGRRLARDAGPDRAGRPRRRRQARDRPRPTDDRGRRRDRREGRGGAGRQGVRRPAGEGAISSPSPRRPSPAWARSTSSISTCRNRRSASAGRRSGATIRTISPASSPPMCSAARAR